MNLIDKEYVACRQIRQKACQIARFIEYRSRSNLQLRTHLICDNVRKGSFTQSRRAVEQGMIERIATHKCRLDEDSQVLDNLLLAGEVIQLLRTDFALQLTITLYKSPIFHSFTFSTLRFPFLVTPSGFEPLS